MVWIATYSGYYYCVHPCPHCEFRLLLCSRLLPYILHARFCLWLNESCIILQLASSKHRTTLQRLPKGCRLKQEAWFHPTLKGIFHPPGGCRQFAEKNATGMQVNMCCDVGATKFASAFPWRLNKPEFCVSRLKSEEWGCRVHFCFTCFQFKPLQDKLQSHTFRAKNWRINAGLKPSLKARFWSAEDRGRQRTLKCVVISLSQQVMAKAWNQIR